MVQLPMSAPLQKLVSCEVSPKLFIIESWLAAGVRSGLIRLRSSSLIAASLLAVQYRKLDFNEGLSGSVKFHTVRPISPVAPPWVLETVNVPV